MRVARQLVAESLLLAIVGGALGLLVTRWGADGLLSLLTATDSAVAVPMESTRPRLCARHVAPHRLVVRPVARVARLGRQPRPHGRSHVSRGHPRRGGSSRLQLGRLLVAAQIAITVLLLAMAALSARTLQQVAHVDIG